MSFIRGIPDHELAKQLASLLNKHNHLSSKKSADAVLHGDTLYVVETHGRFVIGACGIHKQSYSLTEIKHLVVDPQWRGKGIGRFLVRRALAQAATPLLYATVREDNQSSKRVFTDLGFVVSTTYQAGNHQVALMTKANPGWQKTEKLSFVFSQDIEPEFNPF